MWASTDVILVIGAVSIGIVNIITAIKVKEIAHSVNSAATKAQDEIAALRKEVRTLTSDIAERKKIAALLAQTAAKDTDHG